MRSEISVPMPGSHLSPKAEGASQDNFDGLAEAMARIEAAATIAASVWEILRPVD